MKSLDQDPPGYSHGMYIGAHSGNFHPNNGAAVYCNPNHPKYGQAMTFEEQLEYFGFKSHEKSKSEQES